MTTINFHAINHAANDWWDKNRVVWQTGSVGAYQKFMLEEYGIDHAATYIKIVDEKKYMWLLLRWA